VRVVDRIDPVHQPDFDVEHVTGYVVIGESV
jgi:hypothetical protein